jgi:hypothetical protein
MRLPWTQTDDIGIVEFMFLLKLNVAAMGFPPRENALINCGQWN